MAEFQGTPGPWSWEESPTHDTYEGPMDRLIGPGGAEVCNFGISAQYYPVEGSPPNAANKRLMSAAPELLLQLEHTAVFLEQRADAAETLPISAGVGTEALRLHVARLRGEARLIRSAVRKAKGESP